MASSDKELEAQLMEAGNMLVDPPASVEELLPLLDVSPNFCFNYVFLVCLYLEVWSSCAS